MTRRILLPISPSGAPRLTGVLLLWLVLGSCAQGGTATRQPVFDRPGSVTFACFDAGDLLTPLPLGDCARSSGTDDEGNARLHALVTQTSPGQVASVDLRTGTAGRVLDLDRRIPGFTHLEVGAQPAAVIVPDAFPETTFVASFGSRELIALATRRFRPEAAAGGTAVARIVDRLPLPTPPSAIVLDPATEETGLPQLFVALPGGSLLQVPLQEVEGGDGVTRLGFASPIEIPLPLPTGEPQVAAPEELPDYCLSLPTPCAELDPIPEVSPRPPVVLGEGPSPRALALDGEGRLYVADGNQPFLHVVDTRTATASEGIPVSVPTTDLVITPRVPAEIGDRDPTERFLYAVDATDGSVLVVDLGRERLVPISNDPIAPPDRLDTVAAARALEVVTSDYDPDEELDFCDPGELESAPVPRRARGVFLAVASTEGDVRFFDVLDLDAPCRGVDPDDIFVAIRRHRPRGGELFDEPVAVLQDPLVTEETRTTRIGDDGAPRSGSAVRFEPLTEDPGCPEGTFQVFPDLDDVSGLPPVLCGRADPFVTGGESWELSWETAVPTTEGGRGILPEIPEDDPGAVVFRASNPPAEPGGETTPEVPFCSRGVLGRDDVTGLPEGDPLAGYPGDLLVLTGPLPPSRENDPVCRERFRLDDEVADFDDEIREVAFPILEAFQDRLVIATETRDDGPTVEGERFVFTLDEVRRCFPNPVRFRVEIRGAFRVFGSRTRFLHPVEPGADGRCEIDPEQPLERGRALPPADDAPARRFDNGQLVFSLGPARTLAPDETVQVAFSVGRYIPKMRYELPRGGAGSDVRWLPEAGLLYVVDQARQQLVEIDLADQPPQTADDGVLRVVRGRVFE